MGAGGTAGQLLEGPSFFSTVDGAVTQLKWIDNRSLAIGTSLGYVHIWSIAEVSESFNIYHNSYLLKAVFNHTCKSTLPGPRRS